MRKKRITESFAAKVFAYFMTVILCFIALSGVLVTFILDQEEFYERTPEQIKSETMASTALDMGKEILYLLSSDLEEEADLLCQETNLKYQVINDFGILKAGSEEIGDNVYIYTLYADEDAPLVLKMVTNGIMYRQIYSREESSFLKSGWTMRLYVDKAVVEEDEFQRIDKICSQLYAHRYTFIIVAVAAAVLGLLIFLFQLCSAGRRYGEEQVRAVGLAAVPFDLLTAAMVLTGSFLILLLDECIPWDNLTEGIVSIACLIAGISLVIGYCLIWAIQGKAGCWWKNMLISRCLRAILAVCRFVIEAISAVLRGLPDVLGALIGLAALFIIEGILILMMRGAPESFLVIWGLEKLLLIPVVLYLALVLGKLIKGSRNLAEGNLTYQIDTGKMVGSLKEHGENLNRIAEGMNLAVEERMKSEHLKTELITNVSHDIKTPLTSIINYAELITEEQTENEKITEYAQVLTRQSARLKKLIEDLMEASKASTGNVEVHMVPCEVNVLLTQTIGEYEQRLEELGLELVCRQPEKTVRIMADGKLLWRIFDNLMNNICKYALGGTRVYLTLEENNGAAVISFKNISRYPLEITAEELQERFVRGDRSRHTEGNGLGLSISQSLTKLQNGELQLTVDGDFFKVVLLFPLLE